MAVDHGTVLIDDGVNRGASLLNGGVVTDAFRLENNSSKSASDGPTLELRVPCSTSESMLDPLLV